MRADWFCPFHDDLSTVVARHVEFDT